MANIKNDNIISEKKRPLWQTVMAVVSFTLMFMFLGLTVYGLYEYEGRQAFKAFVSAFNCALFMLVLGLRFSVTTSIWFDLKGRRYKKEHKVGPVRLGKWEQLPDIEYVSVFKQAVILPGEDDGHVFNVNVWYGHNQHFTIYTNADGKPAYDMALYIAVRLKMDMLDATDPFNKIWISPHVVTETPGLPPVNVNSRGLR